MARNFRELEAKMSQESRERSSVLAEKYLAEMPLHLLREAREMTQVHLAKILGVNQAAVSELERCADLYVSTPIYSGVAQTHKYCIKEQYFRQARKFVRIATCDASKPFPQ
jgi:hypothetical protein